MPRAKPSGRKIPDGEKAKAKLARSAVKPITDTQCNLVSLHFTIPVRFYRPLTVQGHSEGYAQATTHWSYYHSPQMRPDTHGVNHAGQHFDARGFQPPHIPGPLPTRSAREEVQWNHSTASTVTQSLQDAPRARQRVSLIGRHFVPHTLTHDMAQPNVGLTCEILNESASCGWPSSHNRLQQKS